jgi:hypothetical protein
MESKVTAQNTLVVEWSKGFDRWGAAEGASGSLWAMGADHPEDNQEQSRGE